MSNRALRVTLQGRTLSVPVRRDRRARRITIHIDAAIGGARIVMPVDVSLSEAASAVRKHEDWLLDKLDALPETVPFAPGALVPLRGTERRIVSDGAPRGVIRCVDDEIVVPGEATHLARRLADWFRREARRTISPLALAKATQVDRRVRHVGIRDPRGRWGSCAANGRLSFSWRLILAPEEVLDYVVAHEVAHLVEMNHSPAFWRVVDTLTPHARRAKRWLGDHGNALHRYGQGDG